MTTCSVHYIDHPSGECPHCGKTGMQAVSPTGDEVERVARLLLDWERRREHLNMSPDDKRKFIEEQAAALAALPKASGVEIAREDLEDLIEELQIASEQLRALSGKQKQEMEAASGFSANAIAQLYDDARNALAKLEGGR